MTNKNMIEMIFKVYKLVLVLVIPFLIITVINGKIPITSGITLLTLVVLMLKVNTIWKIIQKI